LRRLALDNIRWSDCVLLSEFDLHWIFACGFCLVFLDIIAFGAAPGFE